MDEETAPAAVPETGSDAGIEPEIPQPAPIGRNFYLVMALIGLLCFLIVFINVPNTRASAATTLMTTNWTLQSYADTTGVLIPVYNGTSVTAQFNRDGTVTGSAGCNRYFATYTVKEYALSITTPGLTKMHCPAPGVMNQEIAFVSLLPQASAIRIHGSDLNIYDNTGQPILVFMPAPE